MKIKGTVSKIVYRNSENGYTVMTVETQDDEVCCVGVMAVFDEGEFVEVEGEEKFHPQYGYQVVVSKISAVQPTGAQEIERYLASGVISGIGVKLAERIVNKFGDDTFRIIEEEPERLAEIKGISETKAMKIAEQFAAKNEMRNAIIFLQQFGISNSTAVKIYTFYGPGMYRVIRENPYRLAEDIAGVGFKTADEIALRAGISPEDDFRIRAALLYKLSQCVTNGHVYLPKEELFEKTREIIEVSDDDMQRQLTELGISGKLIIKDFDGTTVVYLSIYYYMELNTARMLSDLNGRYRIDDTKVDERLEGIVKELDIELDELQRKAVYEAVQNGVFILTGGPGTGKTTTINTIIRYFVREQMEVLLAAPTGRAAKRMSETTGMEAKTIHRLLELQKSGEGTQGGFSFARNENNPLECDVLIIDEASMVDISLMHSLLKAVIAGTRLILVGDVDQLPSVGAGNVLKDMISSEHFATIKLEKIFRQAAESSIIVNAHKINKGEQISLDNKVNNDFFFLPRQDISQITAGIIYLVREKISRFVKASPLDVQVLTPMKAGELGCEKLNVTLQEALNPEAPSKEEKVFENGHIFREGDKVMQIKNDYQLEWTVYSKRGFPIDGGTGVFNGDCGVIRSIDHFSEKVRVEFEEGKMVDYQFSQCDELVLAYAITIHKSQGSEYPAVVMPLLTGPRLLFSRNVLYTAVTRAKKCVTIIGSEDTVNMMISNVLEQKRYSGLERAIREMD